ncbi:hypothetical protein [Amycolatopsis sp. cmx-11-51]|uniref:hypothetical protein n=1 Tax=Amycolatopsis sp. cmx-11-51 TaxID=2785797 RepID=UPI0039E70CC8
MPERNSWAVGSTERPLITTEDARLAVSALLTPGTSAVSARNGIRVGPGDPGKVHQSTPTATGSVIVEAFQGAIRATRGLGSYLATLDSPKTLDILAVPADPANDRYDLVLAQQSDEFYLDTATKFDVRISRGKASATPRDPIPSGSDDYFTLARVRVTAGATAVTDAMIDDLRPGRLVAAGGILPVRDANERDAIAAPYPGQFVIRLDNGVLYRYDSALGWLEYLGSSLPRGLVGEVKRGSPDNVTAHVVLESVTVKVVAGRKYRVEWNANYAATALGPPNSSGWIRHASGNSITTNSTALRSFNLLVNPGTYQPLQVSNTYTATTTETRTFGVTATANSTGTPTLLLEGGGDRRALVVEDIGTGP